MTPKEKAKELVEKFIEHVDRFSRKMATQNAKACAIICVDEILKEQNSWCDAMERQNLIIKNSDRSILKFWQSVKEEINNI